MLAGGDTSHGLKQQYMRLLRWLSVGEIRSRNQESKTGAEGQVFYPRSTVSFSILIFLDQFIVSLKCLSFEHMESIESLWHYYKLTNKEIPKDLLASGACTSHFNVLESISCSATLPFTRRNYYKICLLTNDIDFQTEDGEFKIKGPSIIFCNPEIKYAVLKRYTSEDQHGFICLFNDEYLTGDISTPLKRLFSLFSKSGYPYLSLEHVDYERFSRLFSLMVEEYSGSFEYRKEVLDGLLRIIIFESIKIFNNRCPKVKALESEDRLVRNFLKLLDSQFPIDSPNNVILLKSPSDFADKLNVHTNHLNHILKVSTGRSTSNLIYQRIVAEAVDLLKHSEWRISDIGYSLGFEYPQHFSNFLKKYTGSSPMSYRKKQIL